MNAVYQKDSEGSWWECGVDGSNFTKRPDAEACCSRLVASSDLKIGRLPLETARSRADQSIPSGDSFRGRHKRTY